MSASPSSSSSPSNREILNTFFDYASRGEFGKLGELYTDDFVLEMPFVSFEGKRLEGMAEVAEYLTKVGGRFQISLTPNEIYETSDPDVLIAEYTSTGKFLPENEHYDNRYITVYKFRDGKICEVREFFNPLRADIELQRKSRN